MQVKVSTLSGIALDWAVAHSAGYTDWDSRTETFLGPVYGSATRTRVSPPEYSTDWSLGGNIIEREGIDLYCNVPTDPNHTDPAWRGSWKAKYHRCGYGTGMFYGTTPLIAAMRCYVTSNMGEWVEIPDELL